jgi:hypothetical protein
MFSVPYLVAKASQLTDERCINQVAPLWEIYYKTLPVGLLSAFTFRHLTMIPKFLGLDKGKKRRQFKRDKATALSKLTADYLKCVMCDD